MNFQLTDEQRMLQTAARELAVRHFAPTAYTWDKTGEYPWANAKVLAEHGFTGITLPEADGGQGGTLLDAVLVMEQIAQVCPHSADIVQAANFGAIRQLAIHGGPELKARVLPALLGGEKLIAMGMTEPNAGSATTDLQTKARDAGDHVVLNGSKIFSSNSPHASYWVVWARFGEGARSSGALLLERGLPGFTLGKLETYMSGETHCALYFDECRVPLENVLINHDGFKKLMPVFNVERVGNAVRSLALAQSAFDMAVAHAKQRMQFGRLLCEFQGIQWKFAEMQIKLEAARLLIYRAAANADKGAPSAMETSVAKTYANQIGFEVANEALQIFGGSGYSTEYPLEYIVRRTRGWMIAGGTIEMQKNRIAELIFQRHFNQRPAAAGTKE